MNIEVGEYIRDRAGNIRKVSRTMPIYENDLLLSNSYYIEFDNLGNVETYRSSYIEEIMTKHSHNIIDLIEVDDIVNGERVMCLRNKDCHYDIGTEYSDDWGEYFGYNKDEIKTILTHEQYESNCYRLED